MRAVLDLAKAVGRVSHPLDRYGAIRAHTVDLVAGLGPEEQAIQSMPDTSPTKWHLAHTTWFFETFLLQAFHTGYRVFDADFGYLFNSYYEAVGDRQPRPRRGLLSRPRLEEVHAYRRHVDAAMADWLRDGVPTSAMALLTLGLHHEQQHQELMVTDIKHVLACNYRMPVWRARPAPQPGSLAPLEWHGFSGGVVEIGAGQAGFAFDNERARHSVFLAPFEIASRPVSCGEWAAFIEDGGYRRPELWLSDGWASVREQGWSAPLYWRREADGWWQDTLSGPLPLDLREPVCHVSHFEADAFARWAGARLPTEAEWEHAAVASDVAVEGNLLDSGRLHPAPMLATGGSLQALYGDVWEWTSSAYLPYPGFRTEAGAVGEYNGKFMSGQMVLRGGSCATPPGHLRPSYRNFFPPQARWQFSGLRLARET